MEVIKAKKYFSQNFLASKSYINRIISACNLAPDEIVLEIGPGKGALTRAIAPQVKELICIEKDRELKRYCEATLPLSNIRIIEADALTYPFENLPPKMKLISNVPYHITTPLIEKFLQHKDRFDSIYVTVQLEYGQRMVAKPHSKAYGALTCFVQYHCHPEILFKVPAAAFTPKPKVSSCFMKLDLKKNANPKVHDESLMFALIRQGFNQRRKTILNSLSAVAAKPVLEATLRKIDLAPTLRAENLTLNDYIALANALKG